MRFTKLIKDYSKLSEANLDFKAQSIILSLTANANFPVTVPSLADFTLIKTAYTEALESSIDGAKLSIALKNQAKETLLTAMRNLATNIESLAQGDRAKLISSGFELGSDGENIPPLTGPVSFEILDGQNPGELKIVVKRIPRATSYMHAYTEGPVTENSIWNAKSSTLRTHTLTGLKSGTKVSVRITIGGSRGQEVVSAIQSRVVQ